jgi:hypothetical protein
MTELEKFLSQQSTKSLLTQKQYKNQYTKLFNLLGKNIADSSQELIIQELDEIENSNSNQALLNIAIMVRKMENLGVDKLLKKRENNKKNIMEDIKEKNVLLESSLPSYEDINEYMNHLFKIKNFEDFVINYLLINFNTRNEDLGFKMVSKIADTKDKDHNYMLVSHAGKITFIRNNYKTANTQGTKINEIDDKRFKTAIRALMKDNKGNYLIDPDSVGYKVKKATLNKVGETNYNKIIVNHFRNDFSKLSKISKNRGTNLETIKEYYDIQEQ